MNFSNLSPAFLQTSASDEMECLFQSAGTMLRPQVDDEEPRFHDWVLVRRKGFEFGFTDSEYHKAAARFRWGHGDWLFTQLYFYSGYADVQPFIGELPFDLRFSATREAARTKLAAFDTTRRSHVSDTWDVDKYRLNVA